MTGAPAAPRSALYRGALHHARADAHARRAFRYPVYVACLDLDELGALDRALRWFSCDRRNVFSLSGSRYALELAGRDPSAAASPRGAAALATALRARHTQALAARGLPPAASVRLVTNLAVLGYVFNPVSFFLGYDPAGALTSVLAEVNNTYGGRHVYALGPTARLPPRPGAGAAWVGFRHRRDFFVSPFLHGPRDYEVWVRAPLDGPALAITMHVDAPTGERVFVARLTGDRTPLTDRALAAAALRYPLMTAQVIGLIHYQALRLHLRRVPYRRPADDHRPIGWPGAPGTSSYPGPTDPHP
jgi:hypothetical protein